MYLIIILTEKEDSGTVYKKTLRGVKLKTGKIGQRKIAEKRKSIEEAEVRIGL
jgi:hypothetical protein